MTTRRRRTGKGPTSEKVRQAYNWTWFRAIAIGEKFVFASEVDGGFGSKIGTCEKLTARKYKYTTQVHGGKDVEIVTQVGSIDAIVVKLNKEGEPDRIGTFIPSLRD